MLEKRTVTAEHYRFGGSGTLFVGRSELFAEGQRESNRLADLRGKVQLIYLDPPFGSGGAYEFRDRTAVSAYTDTLREDEYLPLMRSVLETARDLLSDSGSIYVHIDYRMSGRLRMLMDELFGADNLRNEIIWSYRSGGRSLKHYSRKHDTILFYRKSKRVFFDITATGVPRGNTRRNHMKRRADEDGRIYFSIRSGGREYRYYEDDPVYPSDVWDDIEHLHQRDPERTGFMTQKPEALLKRIITASSREGDIGCDLFSGSGTTAAVAAAEGRRFVCCDCGKAALFAARRRLIESSRATELFTQEKPFDVIYMDGGCSDDLDPEKLLLVTPQEDGVYLTVPENNECAFIATGKLDGGTFLEEGCIARPKKNDELFVPFGGALHIVDSGLRQAFFEVTE